MKMGLDGLVCEIGKPFRRRSQRVRHLQDPCNPDISNLPAIHGVCTPVICVLAAADASEPLRAMSRHGTILWPSLPPLPLKKCAERPPHFTKANASQQGRWSRNRRIISKPIEFDARCSASLH